MEAPCLVSGCDPVYLTKRDMERIRLVLVGSSSNRFTSHNDVMVYNPVAHIQGVVGSNCSRTCWLVSNAISCYEASEACEVMLGESSFRLCNPNLLCGSTKT